MTLWFLFILGNFYFEPHIFCECDLILSSPENFSFQVPRSEPAVISFNFELDRNRMRPLIWNYWAVNMWLTLDNFPRLESKHEIEKVRLLNSTRQPVVIKCILFHFMRIAIFNVCKFFLSTAYRWTSLRCTCVWRDPMISYFRMRGWASFNFSTSVHGHLNCSFMFGVPCICVLRCTRRVLKLPGFETSIKALITTSLKRSNTFLIPCVWG